MWWPTSVEFVRRPCRRIRADRVKLRPTLTLATFTLLGFAGCTSVPITPAAVHRAPVPQAEAALAIERWQTAVAIANLFLESPYRRTLPAGTFTLADDGMTFQNTTGVWPVHVRYDVIGQVCVKFGFTGQERADGFAIGKAPPHRSAATDNTFFRTRQGDEQRPEAMAALILHEFTHQLLRDGTVNIPKSAAYYAEAVLLMRYRTLTAERRPFATSEEFNRFLKNHGQDTATQERMLREFEEHLAQGPTKFCRHGPFAEPPAR